VIADTRPVLWACQDSGDIVAAGLMEVGGLTVTGLTLLSDVDENAFLGKVAGLAGSYPPLPDVGTWLEAGTLYAYAGGLVIVRQSHARTADVPSTVPALFSVFREGAEGTLEWIANEKVLVGTRRSYLGIVYEAIQAHTTESTWQPPAVPNLWRVVVEVPPVGEWFSGEQGLKIGDLRTYQGVTYRVIQNPGINIWPPPIVPALFAAV